jgi:predicted negative regulator of RcsB-dependent stress response
LTRHELKEQLQHDQFTDAVSGAVGYAASHRQTFIRGGAALAIVLALCSGAYWYFSHQRSLRQEDLATALAVVDTPVGPANDNGRSFPTEDARDAAALKALSGFVGKNAGSREGLIAQYYLGTLKARKNDTKGAEGDLSAVAHSSNDCAPLAKIALAQLYMNQKKTAEAQALLRSIVNDPTGLVSKAQAQVLLAQLESSVNPKEAKSALQAIDNTDRQRPAVSRAAEQLSSQLSK